MPATKEKTYSEPEIAERLKELPGWYYEDGWIRRVYKTDGWPTTLMQLLPSLVEGDLAGFGAALTAIQRLTGAWFAPSQGGIFAPGLGPELIARMAEWGAAGVGQSSWGPAVYGLVDGIDQSRTLAERVRASLGGRGQVFEGGFARHGARVGWGGPPTQP